MNKMIHNVVVPSPRKNNKFQKNRIGTVFYIQLIQLSINVNVECLLN